MIYIFLALCDLGIIYLSYRLSFLIAFGNEVLGSNWNAFEQIMPFIYLTNVFLFYIFNLYTTQTNRNLLKVAYNVFLVMIIISMFTLGYSYLIYSSLIPQSVILTGSVFEFIMFVILRSVVLLISRGVFIPKKLLFIEETSNNETWVLKKRFANYKNRIFSSYQQANEQELMAQIEDVDAIAISSGIKDKKKLLNLCIKKSKVVFIVPDLLDILFYSADTQYADDTLMLMIKPPGLDAVQRFAKRGLDLIIATLLLVIASPIMIATMLLIPILSPGPAIFKQERLGLNGHPFKLMKFRSMINNAEQKTGPVLAAERDPRITRFGALIRTTRLDELPQLINVIKGDMSIVGPRPERKYFVDQFADKIPYYGYRMAIKPGITGLAQVKGKYTTTAEDKLRFDILYIKNYSFVLDLSILMQTIRVVFQSEKAAGVEVKSQVGVKELAS